MTKVDHWAVRLAQLPTFVVPVAASGATFESLYDFTGKHDGGTPGFITSAYGHVIVGVTLGGNDGAETVYKFNTFYRYESTLHRFTTSVEGTDLNALVVYFNGFRSSPYLPLYGSARSGGSSGNGLLYRLDSQTGEETVLYNFAGGSDGSQPKVTSVVGMTVPPYTETSLFGITPDGGANGDGTIFRFDFATGVKTILYSFTGGSDGIQPVELAGQYGVSQLGGDQKHGVLWSWDGASKVAPIYAFTGGADGGNPVGLTFGPLTSRTYVTTAGGGTLGQGTLTEVTLDRVAATPLYNFGPGTVGCGAVSDLTYGGGYLVGAAAGCGAFGQGTAFTLPPPLGSDGPLYSFSGGVDGGSPHSSLVRENAQSYIGTTSSGGTYGWGTIYKVRP